MHEPLFCKTIQPNPVRVLNLWLRPFSIGHSIILLNRGNPLGSYSQNSFAELNENAQRASLIGAALVCYKSWRGNARPERNILLWGWICRKKLGTGLPVELSKFFAYRNAAMQDFPTVKMPRPHGATYHYFGSPELARLLLFVQPFCKDFGFETPYDFPLGLARQLYSTQLESEGNIWIKNFQDEENEERLKAYEKANPEAGLAIGEEAIKKLSEQWNKDNPENPVNLE